MLKPSNQTPTDANQQNLTLTGVSVSATFASLRFFSNSFLTHLQLPAILPLLETITKISGFPEFPEIKETWIMLIMLSIPNGLSENTLTVLKSFKLSTKILAQICELTH